MMRRFSLSQRLTLLFILLMMLCAAVACAAQLYSSMQYGNAMVQRLSGGLAQQIVQREPILNAQGQCRPYRAENRSFDRLMTFNPERGTVRRLPGWRYPGRCRPAWPYSATKHQSRAGTGVPQRCGHAGFWRRSA